MEQLLLEISNTNKQLAETLKAKDETIAQQQVSLNALIDRINAMTAPIHGHDGTHGAPAVARTAEDIRKAKAATIFQNLQKSQKVRDFKLSNNENIQIHIVTN